MNSDVIRKILSNFAPEECGNIILVNKSWFKLILEVHSDHTNTYFRGMAFFNPVIVVRITENGIRAKITTNNNTPLSLITGDQRSLIKGVCCKLGSGLNDLYELSNRLSIKRKIHLTIFCNKHADGVFIIISYLTKRLQQQGIYTSLHDSHYTCGDQKGRMWYKVNIVGNEGNATLISTRGLMSYIEKNWNIKEPSHLVVDTISMHKLII